MSKDSLIRGTIILAAAAFVARFLGLIQKVPLQHILGDEGMATFGIAYSVYGLLLIVATAGIPSALSKMISEQYAVGRVNDAARMYRAAVWFAVAGGVVSALLLIVAAPYYAVYIAKDPRAVLAIRAIAPALFIFPLIAIMRGYFQGRQVMKAGAISQIYEQLLRVITAVGIAVLLLWLGYNSETIAAGASFGAVTGAFAALAVMLYYQKSKRKLDIQEGLGVSSKLTATLSYGQIYRMMLKLSVPVSLVSMAVPMIYFIDNSTLITLLEGKLGTFAATETLGILTGKAQSLSGIPPILAIALSASLIPVISSAFATKDEAELIDKSSLALRISVITGLPVVIILAVAAEAIIGFLFTNASGWEIASILTASTLFQIVMMTSGAILLGVGKPVIPMVHVLAGIAIKLAGNMLLAPWLGIYGILASTMICFIFVMAMNLLRLRGMVAYRVLGRRWTGFLLTGVAVTAAGIGLVLLFDGPLHIQGRIGYGIEAALIGAVLMLLYPACLFMFRAVTADDVRRFPRLLQRLLSPYQRWFGGRRQASASEE